MIQLPFGEYPKLEISQVEADDGGVFRDAKGHVISLLLLPWTRGVDYTHPPTKHAVCSDLSLIVFQAENRRDTASSDHEIVTV